MTSLYIHDKFSLASLLHLLQAKRFDFPSSNSVSNSKTKLNNTKFCLTGLRATVLYSCCCHGPSPSYCYKLKNKIRINKWRRPDRNLPNQACCSPWTSIARPKSANLTAAPLALLARSRFSGWKETRPIVAGHPMKRIEDKKRLQYLNYGVIFFSGGGRFKWNWKSGNSRRTKIKSEP